VSSSPPTGVPTCASLHAVGVVGNLFNQMVKLTGKPDRRAALPARPSPVRPSSDGAPDGAPDGDAEHRILDAAHAVFLRRGTAGARMREIADEAGVNKALLHYYFRNKDRLAQAVFQQVAQQFFPAVLAALASDDPLEEKVAQVVRLELDHLSRRPYLPGYILSELHHHPDRVRQLVAAMVGVPVEEARGRLFTTLRRQIDERVRAGTMRRIAPEQFVINLLSLCVFPFAARPMLMAILELDHVGFERFIARRRKELVPFFLGALRP
jgi:TetR/AcrR family transcriptional regulator